MILLLFNVRKSSRLLLVGCAHKYFALAGDSKLSHHNSEASSFGPFYQNFQKTARLSVSDDSFSTITVFETDSGWHFKYVISDSLERNKEARCRVATIKLVSVSQCDIVRRRKPLCEHSSRHFMKTEWKTTCYLHLPAKKQNRGMCSYEQTYCWKVQPMKRTLSF